MNSGDLVKARVKIFPLLYHYGIISIDQEGNFLVMHNTPGRGTVIDPLDEFLFTRELIYSEETWLNTITGEELQARFEQCSGEFNLITYNCEHFIDCMLNTSPESEQLQNYFFAILLVIAIFLIINSPKQ